MLIMRVFAEEEHVSESKHVKRFPCSARGSLVLHRSDPLMSSSVIFSRSCADSGDDRGAISSQLIICKQKPTQAGPVHRPRQVAVFETETARCPAGLGSREERWEPAGARTYALTHIHPESLSQISPKQFFFLFIWPASYVPSWKSEGTKSGAHA